MFRKFNLKHKLSTQTYRQRTSCFLSADWIIFNICLCVLAARLWVQGWPSVTGNIPCCLKVASTCCEKPTARCRQRKAALKKTNVGSEMRFSSTFSLSFLLQGRDIRTGLPPVLKALQPSCALREACRRVHTRVNGLHSHLQGWTPGHLCGDRARSQQAPAGGSAGFEAPEQAGNTWKKQTTWRIHTHVPAHTHSHTLLFTCAHTCRVLDSASLSAEPSQSLEQDEQMDRPLMTTKL